MEWHFSYFIGQFGFSTEVLLWEPFSTELGKGETWRKYHWQKEHWEVF
jgi:hypothetical protein